MAQPKTTSFGKFLILLGDGATPEVFTAPCGFKQKAFNMTAASSDTTVPDCADPEAAAWVERGVSSLSGEVTGSGVMAMDSYSVWRTWFLSGESKNIRIEFNELLANGGGYYAGAAVLTTLGHSSALGTEGNKTQCNVTLQSDGPLTWVPALV